MVFILLAVHSAPLIGICSLPLAELKSLLDTFLLSWWKDENQTCKTLSRLCDVGDSFTLPLLPAMLFLLVLFLICILAVLTADLHKPS